MTMKHAIAIAFSLILTGVLAMPPRASAQFDLDLQATEISNQVQKLLNRVTQYTTLLTQFTSLDCSAQGMAAGAEATPIDEAAVACNTLNMIGAFRDSYRQLLAAPPICSIPPCRFPTGATCCNRPTRSPRPTSGTSIRAVQCADAAVATFERRRDHADRSVVLAHAEIDAATALSDTLDAAEAVVADLEARNSVTRTGLRQTQLAATLTRARLIVALAGLRAYQTSTAAADAYNAEVARRELEARRLAERAALEACGPRNRPPWPSAPTRALTPCMAAIGCIRSLAELEP